MPVQGERQARPARPEGKRPAGFWNGALPPIGYRVVAAELRGAKIKKKLEIDPLRADPVTVAVFRSVPSISLSKERKGEMKPALAHKLKLPGHSLVQSDADERSRLFGQFNGAQLAQFPCSIPGRQMSRTREPDERSQGEKEPAGEKKCVVQSE
jgi:hypothetical protein